MNIRREKFFILYPELGNISRFHEILKCYSLSKNVFSNMRYVNCKMLQIRFGCLLNRSSTNDFDRREETYNMQQKWEKGHLQPDTTSNNYFHIFCRLSNILNSANYRKVGCKIK